MFDLSFLEKKIKELQDKNLNIKNTLENMGHKLDIEKPKNNGLIFETKAKCLKELKIACVMDRFTLDSYMPECSLLEITPENWNKEIDDFKPDILFIESAWQGKDKLWYRKIANGSKEFFDMASYCQEKHIPIVFWNKEDPIYTDTFMPVARMADVVFTTDIDCIKKYKEELGHENVYHLHFAAQPAVHNPIEKYNRKEKFCFAGAYYHKYKQRSKVFDNFSEVFINTKGFDIYDRNYRSALPEHAFPERYNPYILGKLDPSEIDIAYKGYYYGINMNSVNQSQTMFARRVFEMLASNTITVGNYSRGVKNLFGDLTICTDDSDEMKRQINLYCSDEKTSRKYRLLGLRSVLKQHLYEDRLNFIAEKVFNKTLKRTLPTAVIFTDDESKIDQFKSQTYENKKLYVMGEGNSNDENIEYITEEKIRELDLSKFENSFVGIMSKEDYYGKNYILDLMLSLRYGDFDAVGKEAYYEYKSGKFDIICKENSYKKIGCVDLTRGFVSCENFAKSVSEIRENTVIECKNGISTDEFNYCKGYCGEICTEVDDLFVSDKGISMEEIYKCAENIKLNKFSASGVKITGKELFDDIFMPKGNKVRVENTDSVFKINSNLKDDENIYIYFKKLYNTAEFINDGKINFIFNGTGESELIGVCVFYDKDKNKILPAYADVGRISQADVPNGAVYFKLGIRIRKKGINKINGITIGAEKKDVEMSTFLSRSNVLVLSNQYPSYDNLYRNMFVHKRMTGYKSDGFVYDVMRMNIYANNEYSEFEGINIVEGRSEVLYNILSNGKIDTVCVHFLDRQMWEVLKEFKDRIRIIVWVHGAEIQPWWRREYNFRTEEELKKGKADSKLRVNFWNEIFSIYENYNMKFVFVSKYFADMIMEDYKIKIKDGFCYIIHNCIDTNLFEYSPKTSDDRKHIVSIRPYTSMIYGNDIMVSTILELSKRKIFNDLKFTIKGSGIMFNEILNPIKKFKNVSIENTFLRQNEIYNLYQKNGIVLIPTRGDTHGVSRDEAMASGLVPITNAVAAIPEFVDESCGILVPAEDYKAMADGIEKLYNEPEYFLKLSENAAKRVRKQTAREFTICKEEELINK